MTAVWSKTVHAFVYSFCVREQITKTKLHKFVMRQMFIIYTVEFTFTEEQRSTRPCGRTAAMCVMVTLDHRVSLFFVKSGGLTVPFNFTKELTMIMMLFANACERLPG